jgi:hypothetical protein
MGRWGRLFVMSTRPGFATFIFIDVKIKNL